MNAVVARLAAHRVSRLDAQPVAVQLPSRTAIREPDRARHEAERICRQALRQRLDWRLLEPAGSTVGTATLVEATSRRGWISLHRQAGQQRGHEQAVRQQARPRRRVALSCAPQASSRQRSQSRRLRLDYGIERLESMQAIEHATHGTARHSRNACCVAALDRAAQIAQLGDGIVDVVGDARELGAKLAAARLTLAAIVLYEAASLC